MIENRKREAELERERSNNYSLEKMIVLLHNMNSRIVDSFSLFIDTYVPFS